MHRLRAVVEERHAHCAEDLAQVCRLGRVAFFSMEFALSEALPYSGGLGVLAGDYLNGERSHGIPP